MCVCMCAYVCEREKEKDILAESAYHTSHFVVLYIGVILCIHCHTVLYILCFICGETASV